MTPLFMNFIAGQLWSKKVRAFALTEINQKSYTKGRLYGAKKNS